MFPFTFSPRFTASLIIFSFLFCFALSYSSSTLSFHFRCFYLFLPLFSFLSFPLFLLLLSYNSPLFPFLKPSLYFHLLLMSFFQARFSRFTPLKMFHVKHRFTRFSSRVCHKESLFILSFRKTYSFFHPSHFRIIVFFILLCLFFMFFIFSFIFACFTWFFVSIFFFLLNY